MASPSRAFEGVLEKTSEGEESPDLGSPGRPAEMQLSPALPSGNSAEDQVRFAQRRCRLVALGM